ncbi:hypothetical protein ACHAPJ_011364 [Fusarium lateritium]
MHVDKLTPDDARVERSKAVVNGRTYTYILAKPAETPKGHIFLAHGFPDMAFGWRYQIPFLQSLGYEVLAPNMLGYGGTATPEADDVAWGFKTMSDDVASLVATVWSPKTRIVMGGHDWGGALAWRVALWHPELLVGVFSVCTPYWAPNPVYMDLEVLVNSGKLPSFGYQLQFIKGEVEEHIKTPDDVRRFLLALYGNRTADTGEVALTAKQGISFDRLSRLADASPLISAPEIEEYVRVYCQEGDGVIGPLRWYRMRERVFEEEKPLASKGVKIQMPSLFIQATRDFALPPAMARGMEVNFTNLTMKKVEASHWALWQTPDRVNAGLRDWLTENLEGQSTKSSL